MNNIVELDDQRPHAMIPGASGNPHVVPVECLKRMADGRNELINEGQESVDIDLIRGIISDWLRLKEL